MLQVDKSPSFKKTISPGYDSDAACWVKVFAMFLIALFGINGIKVAGQINAYTDYIWVPVLLLFLSVTVLVTNLVRLAKKYGAKSTM